MRRPNAEVNVSNKYIVCIKYWYLFFFVLYRPYPKTIQNTPMSPTSALGDMFYH